MQPTTSVRKPQSALLVTLIVGFASMVFGGWAATWVRDRFVRGSATSGVAATSESAKTPAAPTTKVTLPEGKLKSVGIKTEPARIEELPTEIVVAGTIEPDPYRRVDVRPRAPGLVTTVNVQPSQKVKAGDLLALLESPDVGTARLNLRARQLDLSIARTESDWRSTIATNVEALIPLLRGDVGAKVIEKQFAAKPLGSYRADLLSAYAEFEIASHEEGKQTQLFKEKIVGEHLPFLAKHTRESAQAKFEAAMEQVRFDASQQKRIADQSVRRAEAGVIDAFKRLQILGVHEGPADPLIATANSWSASSINDDITAYPISAPFEGTILSTSVVPSQRAELTDGLFVLADLTTVRVVANIPEADLAQLHNHREGTIRFTAAAYPGRSFEAKMLYTAEMVDPTTRRVRLVAEAANKEGLLRLGMFVQVRLTEPSGERVLTVPTQAVVEIDGRKVVFLAGEDGKTFTLRRVLTGRDSGGRQMITGGLAAGEKVVSSGAFMLKSELILQSEPDEE
jgi:membrane fusion protein, heavy metal efflux system